MPDYSCEELRELIHSRGISDDDVQRCIDGGNLYHRLMETVYRGETADGRYLKVAVDHFGKVVKAFTHH